MRVPPGASSRLYEEPLETVASGPEVPFDAIEIAAALARERQLAVDMLERIGCQFSLNLRVLGALEALTNDAERVLGLQHAAGGLLRQVEQFSETRVRFHRLDLCLALGSVCAFGTGGVPLQDPGLPLRGARR